MTKPIKSWQPWLFWVLGASVFFSEYFGRVAPSVMVHDLMHAFQADALSLGTLSVFFYYAYVSMQMPVGALVDRFGPQRLLAVTSGLCGVGCILFATAHNLFMADAGRLLMGFGAAFAFVSTLKLATIWFPPQRFGLLAGLTQAIGMLGAAVGQGPLSYSVTAIGWRPTMWIIAAFLLLLSALIAIFVKDKPPATLSHLTAQQPKYPIITTLKTVFKNGQSWWNALYAAMIFSPTAAFAAMWGPSFLHRAYHLSINTAGMASSCIYLGWAVGGPFIGLLSDRVGRRRPIMLLSAIASFITMTCVIYLPQMSIVLVFVLLFLYGLSNTGVGVSYAVSGEINPKPMAGTSVAFCNMASVIVGAGFQPFIGWILDLNWHGEISNHVRIYSLQAFHHALLVLPICLFIGIITTFMVKETYCQHVK